MMMIRYYSKMAIIKRLIFVNIFPMEKHIQMNFGYIEKNMFRDESKEKQETHI